MIFEVSFFELLHTFSRTLFKTIQMPAAKITQCNRRSSAVADGPRDALCQLNSRYMLHEQGVALTGRNSTGPPCSRKAIIRLEAAWRHRLACAGKAACRPDVECYRRRQTPESITSLTLYTKCKRAINNANGSRVCLMSISATANLYSVTCVVFSRVQIK